MVKGSDVRSSDTFSAHVYEALRREILSGTIPPPRQGPAANAAQRPGALVFDTGSDGNAADNSGSTPNLGVFTNQGKGTVVLHRHDHRRPEQHGRGERACRDMRR
jgi:hypothetical protein